MSLLTQFEQQYSVQTAEITSKIGRLSSMSTSDRITSIRTIERLLTEAEDLLEQMELSVRELPTGSADRNKYDLRVKSYRNDKRQLDVELKRAIERIKANADRDELMAYDDDTFTVEQVTV
jgi:vesicle transport through interaction with t-SNAREs protein 1